MWQVYYDDGATFRDVDGPPHTAPKYGILAIWQDAPHQTLFNCDYYLWRTDWGCWIEVQPDGLIDHLTTAVQHISAVLVGRTVPKPLFKATMQRLNADHQT